MTAPPLADGADEIDVVLPVRGVARRRPRPGGRTARDRAWPRRATHGEGDHRDRRAPRPSGDRPGHPLRHRQRRRLRQDVDRQDDVSATPEAAEIVLEAIEVSGRPVGFKASGGIRTLADAATYLDLADRSWARIGRRRRRSASAPAACSTRSRRSPGPDPVSAAGPHPPQALGRQQPGSGGGVRRQAHRVEHPAGLVGVEDARLDDDVDDRAALVDARWTSSAARA